METNLLVGSGVAEITPRQGEAKIPPAEGPGSPLLAKALAFECQGRAAALVGYDLVLLTRESVEKVRSLVEERTGIPAAQVMLCASHTHSGPATSEWLTKDLDRAYLEWVAEQIAEAVAMAWDARQPSHVAVGKGICGLAVNRWVETPTGAHWGVAWDAPTDNSVTVLEVTSPEGTPRAAMVNFAAHASVMSFGKAIRYSADFPGFLRDYLEERYPGLSAVFTNGASGDLKIAFVDEEGRQFAYGDLEDARRYGYELGREAEAAMQRARPRPVDGLRVASVWCELPVGEPPSRKELLREIEKPHYPQFGSTWGHAMLEKLDAGTLPRSFSAEVQALRLGDVATLVAVPVEAFAEIGLRLRSELARFHPGLCLIGYANGYAGYLPARRSVMVDGPKPRYDWCKFLEIPAVYTADAEDVLVEAVHRVLNSLGDGGTSTGEG
jgi:neutral ceramidase